MKATKIGIPTECLVNRYLPADYMDAFVCETGKDFSLTPDDLSKKFWADFPVWVKTLFNIRNFLVRFVGLKGGSQTDIDEFTKTVVKSGNETVLLLSDKHLDAYLSIYIEELSDRKKVYAITLIRYKMTLGRIYFLFIRPFHGLIVRSSLKRALR